eukprot:scaffold110734_cov75-Phaeocystis_antarctica.AAC.4
MHGPHKSSNNAGMLDEKGSRNEQALANSRTAAAVAEEKNAAEAKRGGLKGGASAEVENKRSTASTHRQQIRVMRPERRKRTR